MRPSATAGFLFRPVWQDCIWAQLARGEKLWWWSEDFDARAEIRQAFEDLRSGRFVAQG